MSYKVVKAFSDLQDNNHVYQVGDSFPHNGYKPSKERIEELASVNNKRGEILIKGENDKENIEEPAKEAKKGKKVK